MASTDVTFRLFGRDVSASDALRRVGEAARDTDREVSTASKVIVGGLSAIGAGGPLVAGTVTALAGVAATTLSAAAGVGALFAVVKTEVSKATEALKLWDAMQEEGVASSQDLAESQRTVRDTSNRLADAQRGVADAERSLDDARRTAIERMEDMQARSEDLALTERRAALEVREAKIALNKTLRDPKATEEDRERARISYAEQVNSLKDVRRESRRLKEEQARAAKAGVEGSDQVRAAQERLQNQQESVQGVTEKLADETQRLKDEENGVTKASTAFEKAFKAMSPATQQFFFALRDLRDAWKKLSGDLAGQTMPIFTKSLRTAQSLLPQLVPVITEVSRVFSAWFDKVLQFVASEKFTAWVKGFTSDSGSKLSTILQTVTNLVSGLAALFGAIVPKTDNMTKGILGASEAFKTWATGLEGSAGLEKFRDLSKSGGEELKTLAATILTCVQALGPFLGAATLMAQALIAVTDATPEPVLKAITTAVIAGTLAWRAWTAGVAVHGAATTAWNAVQTPALATARAWVVVQWQALTGWVRTAAATVTATAGLVAHKAATIAMSAATKAAAAAQWLMNAALAANPIGLVIIAVVALVAAFVIAYKKSATFRAIVQGALKTVATTAKWLWGIAKDLFGWLKRNWGTISKILAGPLGLAVRLIRKHWDSIVNGVKGLKSRVTGAARGMWDGVREKTRALVTWVRERVTAVIDTVRGVKARITGAAKGMWDGVREKTRALVAWIPDRISGILDTISGLRDRITSRARGMWDGIREAFRDALNWIIDKWNSLRFELPSFEIAGQRIGGGVIDIPDLPRLAAGGIVRARPGGTLAVLGEGGRDEAVIPLGRGGTGGVVINVDVHVGAALADPIAIGRAAERGLRAAVSAGALRSRPLAGLA